MSRLRIAIPALAALVAASAGAQNLLINPDFNENPDGWLVVCGSNPVWQMTEDEAGCPGSGSVAVTSGACPPVVGSAFGQCLPVGSLAELSATGRVRAASGFVGAGLEFYDAAGCTGNLVLQVSSTPTPASGQWQTVTLDQAVPSGSVSVLVGFGALDLSPVDSEVDAGYAGAVPLVFRDDFEGDTEGDTVPCRWSAAVP